MFYVYILLSEKDGNFYIGMTGDLKRRIGEHKAGKVKSTKHRKPIELICYEAYTEKKDAQRREKFLKSSDGKKDIRIRLKNLLEK
ncbi:MAG: GIY-YIG nuclease family protein [Candidatus Moranbacteria bacterium]|nr:GIY-YIG nuclease family protein [Candidatus Moranbacteria bacterium]